MQNKDKRIPKDINLTVSLSEEQKAIPTAFHVYDVIFVNGDFGTGKTLSAVHTAITAFRKKQFNKIWISRPIVDNKKLGALPGELSEKLAPYVFPIMQNINTVQRKDITEKMFTEGEIEVMPIEVAKGVTFVDSVVIIDEFQDLEYQDFRTILTRIGEGSKIIFCGSKQQIDRKVGENSCYHIVERLKDSGLVGWIELETNRRNPALTKIIDFLEK